jgi:solute carrier family 34 (sodium-dependent phosphate cotransporter)
VALLRTRRPAVQRRSAISPTHTPVAQPDSARAETAVAPARPVVIDVTADARAGMAAAERAARLVVLVALLYAFLVGIDLVGTGIAGLGGGFVDTLFRGISHPLAGLAVGVLATGLVQSSSVTTSMVVAMVGAGALTMPVAVPVIMGANIGTTITNTLASVGAIRRTDEFRRAFAGATVHDLFNLLTVVVLLPLELLTGVLSRAAIALSGVIGGAAGGEFNSPVAGVVGAGAGAVDAAVGSVASGSAPAVISLAIGLVLIFGMLVAITKNMRLVIAQAAERSLNAALGRSGVLGMLVGLVLTIAVQSSSIATSLLVPMMAAGVLTLRNAYPITLGANVGTTVTALLAALAVPQIAGLQIALVHLLFNMAGILLFYPVPALRRLPIAGAQWLAEQAIRRRPLVIAYVVTVFLLVPAAGIALLG